MLESYIFRQTSAKILPKTKAALLWRLSFRIGSFGKACLQPLVNRISIKTLENYIPSYTGPALSRCNRCNCIGPRASGGPAPWCSGSLFIFARYSLRSRIQ